MKLPKVSLKSVLIDILIVLIGITGALFFAYHFLRDINATLVRMEETPVGTITSRYNIVQRRFSDRLAWDRLRNNSPVYNGDVIRTDNLSEVTISFDHGDIISLFSNTLVQVHVGSDGNRIDFSSGELIINTPETITATVQPVAETRRGIRRRRDSESQSGFERPRNSMVINTGDQRVRLERGSAIRLASNNEGDLELSVNEGAIVLEEAPPEEPRSQRRQRNQQNPESSILSERPESSERSGRDSTNRDGRRRSANTEGTENAELSERVGSARTERTERLENMENTERRRRTETADGSETLTYSERPRRAVVINTGEQRIRTERGSSIRVGSQDGEIDIAVTQGAMVVESAVTDETLTVETGHRVRMNRQNSRRESDEITEISDLIIETVEQEPTERTRRERSPRGNEAEPGTERRNTETARAERSNRESDRTERSGDASHREPRTRQRELLPPPRNRIPLDQHTITPQMIIDSRSLTFSWDSVRDANGYILTIFRDNEGFRNSVLETPILTETTYTIENIRRFRGNLYWQVEAVRVSDNGSIEMRGQLRENALIVDIPRREESLGSERIRNPERSQERTAERRNRLE